MKNFLKLFALAVVTASLSASLYMMNASAFTGPGSQSAGSGNGAIGVNGSNNISVGTTTPSNSAKMLIVGSSTSSGDTALQILQSTGGTILIIKNDGSVGVGTTTTQGAGSLVVNGSLYTSNVFGGNVNASSVNPGIFGTGNFAFPSSLGINTSTNVGLPAALYVNGSSSFTQTSTFASDVTVNGNLDVNGTNAWFNAVSASSTVTIGAALNQSAGAVSLASTTINGNVTTTRLTVSGLGSTGNPCLITSATGVISTSSCGGGALSGGQNNYFALWTGASSIATTTLQQNGTTTWVSNGFAVGTSTIQPTGNLYATGAITSNGHTNVGNVTTTNLTVSNLGSTGNPCLTVGTTGVVATGTCGGGALSGGQANYYTLWSSGSAITTSSLQANGTTTYTLNGFAVGTSTIQPTGTIYSIGNITTLGNFVGNIGASNVTAGTFAAGNFAFNGRLGVQTSSAASLPDNLDIYGKAGILGTSSAATFNVQASGTTVFSVDTATSTLFLLEVQNSAGSDVFTITTSSVTSVNGHLSGNSGAPTNSACGSATPVITGNDFAGQVTVSSTATSSCTVAFATSFKVNPPICVVTNQTTSTFALAATSTKTTLTVQAPPANSSTFNHLTFSYICIGRNE